MRNRRAAQEQVAEVARRRLELLSAELAGISRSLEDQPRPVPGAGRRVAVPPGETGVRRTPDRAVEVGRAPSPQVPEPAHLQGAEGADDPPRPGRHAHRPLPLTARGAGWARDRLPPTLQGRVGLSSSHVTVVALLVAGALAVTTWWVLRAEADPVVMAPAAARSPASVIPDVGDTGTAVAGTRVVGSPAGAEASAPDRAVVVVDVAGKVRRPGIATLPVGSRVVDALEAAGGVRRGVDLTTVNLARVLVDGEQIVVGIPPPGGVAAPAASAPVGPAGAAVPLVNLNTATQAQLEELPGVGPVTAQAILQWRADHGAFTAVDELLEVSGIGEATLAELAPFVTL